VFSLITRKYNFCRLFIQYTSWYNIVKVRESGLSLRLLHPAHVYVVTYLSHVSRLHMHGWGLSQTHASARLPNQYCPSTISLQDNVPGRPLQSYGSFSAPGLHRGPRWSQSGWSSIVTSLFHLAASRPIVLDCLFLLPPPTAVTGEKVPNHGILFSTSQARPLASWVSSMSSEC
jgi:hypothetical protein